MSPKATDVTRLAPSPTGALHLGNARTFLVNHLLARQNGWRTLLRVEDLDGPRVKAQATDEVIQELAWLGFDWQGPVGFQSQRAQAYRQALERLAVTGWAYPCVCSRKDVEQAASAPHVTESAAYAGTCRGRYASAEEALRHAGRPSAWRVRVEEAPIEVRDQFAGNRAFDLAWTCGDFVIFKSDSTAAYQLAVVVDDHQAGVTAIVRGDDLLESAARQTHLRRLLGLGGSLRYWHLPLVVGADGRRLAKRHGDTRLAHYRQCGARPERILGLLGFWCGLLEDRREADMAELLRRFDLGRLPRQPVVFSPEDDRFLRAGK